LFLILLAFAADADGSRADLQLVDGRGGTVSGVREVRGMELPVDLVRAMVVIGRGAPPTPALFIVE